ncbi:MAG: hypothetical protein H6Q72_321 [Firmicutes bacterium]|nr:hypothetical protein [Bacillota bacterium]
MTIIKPMLAKAGSLPDTEAQSEYSFEIKWDGITIPRTLSTSINAKK